jgi:hypothetical protein
MSASRTEIAFHIREVIGTRIVFILHHQFPMRNQYNAVENTFGEGWAAAEGEQS